jgi:hypothetical protein
MRRTTIMLPAALKSRAARQARSEGISLGELIRDSVERRLAARQTSREHDPLFADEVTFKDDWPGDVAENHDKYLLKLLEEQYGPDRKRLRRRKSQ